MAKFKVGDVVATVPAGTNVRKAPEGEQVVLRGKRVVRPKGFRFKVEKVEHRGKYIWYRGDLLEKHVKSDKPRSPVPGYGVNYPFGVKNSRYSAGFHTGCDLAAPTGTKVVAVTDGTITRADDGGAYGKWTHLKSVNGRTYVYCHQSARSVSVGDKVKAGQVIGHVGTTGNVTGPHLHFEATRPGEAWAYGRTVNPMGTW